MDAKETRRVVRFMNTELEDPTSEAWDHGEINLTRLAEIAADQFGHNEWLDDPLHPIWDIAYDVADRWE
jgi:hypothetical protein